MRIGTDYDKTPDHNKACGRYVNFAVEPQKGSLCIFTIPLRLDVSTMYHQKLAFVQLTLFMYHNEKDETNMCFSLCRLVRDRSSEDWSRKIINRIASLALHYNSDEKSIHADNDDDLDTQSLNCVRGSAAHALSSLLWTNFKRYPLLQPTIDALVHDKDAVIRQAILEAVIATFNIDKEQAKRWFFELVNSDERIARNPRAVRVLVSLWRQ